MTGEEVAEMTGIAAGTGVVTVAVGTAVGMVRGPGETVVAGPQ